MKKPVDHVCWQFWFLVCYSSWWDKEEERRSPECTWTLRKRFLEKIGNSLSHWPSWCRGREDVMRSGPWVESKETHEPCLQTQNKQTGLEGWGKQNNIWKCMERTVWRPTWGLFLWNVFSVWLTGIRKWRGILRGCKRYQFKQNETGTENHKEKISWDEMERWDPKWDVQSNRNKDNGDNYIQQLVTRG